MKTGGWLSDWKGLVFAGTMLVVMAATAYVGLRLDLNGFAVNVLASLFSIALGLLIGYLLVDRFSDYLAEQQWAKSRQYTLRAIIDHLSEIAGWAFFHFQCKEQTTIVTLWEGGSKPRPDSAEAFGELITESRQVWLDDMKDNFDSVVGFQDAISRHLHELQTVVIPRVIEMSRNQLLIDALMEFDYRQRALDDVIRVRKIQISRGLPEYPPFPLCFSFHRSHELLEVCGKLYRIVAEEWDKCLPKGTAAGRSPHGS